MICSISVSIQRRRCRVYPGIFAQQLKRIALYRLVVRTSGLVTLLFNSVGKGYHCCQIVSSHEHTIVGFMSLSNAIIDRLPPVHDSVICLAWCHRSKPLRGLCSRGEASQLERPVHRAHTKDNSITTAYFLSLRVVLQTRSFSSFLQRTRASGWPRHYYTLPIQSRLKFQQSCTGIG